ncbi:cytochrome P450 [Burkholderia sp. WSM2232]|uniref:cytochrome P450 n=1 Tax=Burkholderia sp. WSM2232 TaxID=944436 RepID=UPI000486ED4F|nr:cytochrome P450 [Burkholderia sp. WSM2232]
MEFSAFTGQAFFEDPYPTYGTLRSKGPLVRVAPNALMSGHYDVVETLMHDRRTGMDFIESVRVRYGEEVAKSPLMHGFNKMFLLLNPPVHTRLRGLMMKTFNARQIERFRDIASATAHRLVDAFESRRHADLTAEFAFPLPVEIICRMLDVPVQLARSLGGAANKIAKVFDLAPMDAKDLDAASEAFASLQEFFGGMVSARRDNPGTDLISLLISVEEGGETLTSEEIVSNVILLFLAGHETTTNMIGNMLIALHRHPDQLEMLKSEPDRIPRAVVECLRYDGSVQLTLRATLTDIEVAGIPVPRGTALFLLLGSANRDPGKFTEPDRLNINRDEGRVLTFGAGIHHCLGQRLALLELETALRVLLERLPALKLTNLETLNWNRRGNLRGVDMLTAVW